MTELPWKNSCCRKRGCPEVATDDDYIYIRDDYGGQVKLTPDELDGILYTLAKEEMEAASCCSDRCVHTFTDENGIGDYEKKLVTLSWEAAEQDEQKAISRMMGEETE